MPETTEQTTTLEQAAGAALRRLVGAGTQLRPWPRDVMTAAWKAANELYDEIGNRNERFKRIWESYRKYRDEEFLWFRVAEYSYANFAFTAAQTVK